jgi:uncharacterized protein GlcG (DUF336 family)
MLSALLSGSILLGSVYAADQPVIVNIKRMSLETAMKIGQASIAACRKEGVQISVTVVDRGGHAQVVMRDVLASDVTLEISKQKAYTAMAFNSATSALEGRFKTPFSPGKVQGLMLYPGGVPVHAGGSIIGGVGVSGAPSGMTDEACAKAGVEAVSGDLEFAE